MGLIKPLRDKTPAFGSNCFVAETAVIIGDVTMGNNCSIWYNAVLRGDVHYIKIGNSVNIQDGVVIHASYQKYATEIGNNVSIGHKALVHGCTIHDDVLIGMGAIVMDNCTVESNSIVAAGAVVTKGTHIKSGSIYAGIPAKKIGTVTDSIIEKEIKNGAKGYIKYMDWYRE